MGETGSRSGFGPDRFQLILQPIAAHAAEAEPVQPADFRVGGAAGEEDGLFGEMDCGAGL
jgi:hypothetical protein